MKTIFDIIYDDNILSKWALKYCVLNKHTGLKEYITSDDDIIAYRLSFGKDSKMLNLYYNLFKEKYK